MEPLDPAQSVKYRLEKWEETDYGPPNEALPSPKEHLPRGTSFTRKDWVTLI